MRDDGNEEWGEAYNLIEVKESEKERKIVRKKERKKERKIKRKKDKKKERFKETKKERKIDFIYLCAYNNVLNGMRNKWE